MATNFNRSNWKLHQCINKCYDEFIIDLSNGNYGDDDMEIVAHHLIKHRKCKQLLVNSNQITEIGAAHLAKAFEENTCLEKLNIGYNKIGDKGLEYLVEPLLINNDTLIKLHLQANSITEHGAQYLAEMLRNNNAIIKLGLDYNQLGDKGVNLLCSALISNDDTRLKALYLDSNRITDEGAQDLAEMLKFNQTLTGLALGLNDISDLGVGALIQSMLDSNTHLCGISLFSNERITDKSVSIFLELFNQTRRLNMFKLYNCSFSADGEDQLKNAAEHKKGLTLLFEGDCFDYKYNKRRPTMRRWSNTPRNNYHENWFKERKQVSKITNLDKHPQSNNNLSHIQSNQLPDENIHVTTVTNETQSTICSMNEHQPNHSTINDTIGFESLTIGTKSSSTPNKKIDTTSTSTK